MSETNKFRSRVFCAVLYPEDTTHAAAIARLESGGYNFAGILHDKDVDQDGNTKKPHWHLVIRFKNAVWNTAVAKELGIQLNYLEACKNVDGALCYLVHFGNDDKFQYEYEQTFGPLRLKLATLLADTDEGTRALNILEIIEKSPGPIGYSEALKKVCAAGLYADFRRMGSFATCLIREHNDECRAELEYRQDMETLHRRFGDFVANPGEIDFAAMVAIMRKYHLWEDTPNGI